MSMRRLYTILLIAIIFLSPGCSRQRPIAINSPAATQPELRAGSSLTILTKAPPSSSATEGRYEEFVPPTPIGALSNPAYPEAARKAKFGAASIFVRVSLDAAGTVIDTSDAPGTISSGGQFAEEFRSAAWDAVRQWKFRPAELQECEDGKDMNGDGKPDYKIVISKKRVPVYFDVRFDFFIEGK